MEQPGQVDTTPVEDMPPRPAFTGPTSLLAEQQGGGLTPLTRPVGGPESPTQMGPDLDHDGY